MNDPGIRRYLAVARKQPRLTREQESDLLLRFQAGDAHAGNRVAGSVLAFVAQQASRYRRYPNVDIDDLVAAANEGLVYAMRRWRPSRGTRLISYAKPAIKWYCLQLVLATRSVVPGGSAFRGNEFWRCLRAVRAAYCQTGSDDEALVMAANKLHVAPEKLRNMMLRIDARDAYLDEPNPDGRPTGVTVLAAFDSIPIEILERRETEERTNLVAAQALACLDERERGIVMRSIVVDEPESFAEQSRRLGISRERTRQIQLAAMRKMRRGVGVQTAEKRS